MLDEIGGKVDRWANLIVNSYLHRRLVWKAIRGTTWRTITYPFPVMMLTEDQGNWLTKELYRTLLLALGSNINLPRAYRHASKIFQGMGFPEIVVEQKIAIVNYCMIYGISGMLMGKAMRASAEQIQIKIGMGTPFVQLPSEKFGTWTTKTWLKMMWKNLGRLEIELLWSDLPSLTLQKEGDKYIMA